MQKQNETTSLLPGLQPLDTGEKTAKCPDDQIVAAWYEHRLKQDEAQIMVGHLSDCVYCRSRVGMLERLAQEQDENQLTEDMMVRAKRLVAVNPVRQHAWAPAWAAAAVLVLGLSLAVNSRLHRNSIIIDDPPGKSAPQLRNIEAPRNQPVILLPSNKAILNPGALAVQWTPVIGSLYYEMLIMDDAGRLLLTRRLQETKWWPTGELELVPGGHYYVRINAYLADGHEAGSQHVAFSVRDIEPGQGTAED